MADTYKLTRKLLVNDFATRSFLDSGDQDYIAARLSYRAKLSYPCLWQSQQALEKYLKCILLLHRIPAKNVGHSLCAALDNIKKSGILSLGLTPATIDLINRLEEVGEFRYLEVSYTVFSNDIIRLDRAVWELRRFCTLNPEPRNLSLKKGEIAPKYELQGGFLESIYRDNDHPAREGLMWNNAFIGRRSRRHLRMRGWIHAVNAPLYMHPEILDEVLRYVFLPKRLVLAWRQHKAPDIEVPED
jgi:HEPN domain-containing protein